MLSIIAGHEMLVQLVHEAHENGLICYVSAGIEDKHVPDAVIAGVDGIGIGKLAILAQYYSGTSEQRTCWEHYNFTSFVLC